jgi:hypothetical protein
MLHFPQVAKLAMKQNELYTLVEAIRNEITLIQNSICEVIDEKVLTLAVNYISQLLDIEMQLRKILENRYLEVLLRESHLKSHTHSDTAKSYHDNYIKLLSIANRKLKDIEQLQQKSCAKELKEIEQLITQKTKESEAAILKIGKYEAISKRFDASIEKYQLTKQSDEYKQNPVPFDTAYKKTCADYELHKKEYDKILKHNDRLNTSIWDFTSSKIALESQAEQFTDKMNVLKKDHACLETDAQNALNEMNEYFGCIINQADLMRKFIAIKSNEFETAKNSFAMSVKAIGETLAEEGEIVEETMNFMPNHILVLENLNRKRKEGNYTPDANTRPDKKLKSESHMEDETRHTYVYPNYGQFGRS